MTSWRGKTARGRARAARGIGEGARRGAARASLPPAASGLAFAALLSVAARVDASGFHVDEQDARATGRAGAVTASPMGPEAVYYNPAGLAELSGVQLSLGAALVSPTAEFRPAEGGAATKVDERRFVLPQFFASARLAPWLAAGFGAYSPFGLAIRWPESSPGRAELREAELQTFFLTPAVGVDASALVPGLSFGAGLDLVPAAVRLERDVPFGTDYGSVALGGDALGVGVRGGLGYRSPALPLSIGLTFRSRVPLDFSGEADFDAPARYRAALPVDGSVSTRIVLPLTLGLGVAVRPLPAWELEVDGTLRGWSSYDELDIELPDGSHSRSPRNYHDSFVVRVGSEVAFAPGWAARLGFVWDETPIPSESVDFQLPDANRFDVTAGLGGEVAPGLRVDLAGLYVLPSWRTTAMSDPLEPPVKGRFEIQAWVLNLSLTAVLGAGDRPAAPSLSPLGTVARSGSEWLEAARAPRPPQ